MEDVLSEVSNGFFSCAWVFARRRIFLDSVLLDGLAGLQAGLVRQISRESDFLSG